MKRKIALLTAILLCVCVLFSGCGEELGLGNADVKIKLNEDTAIVTELPNKTGITTIVIPDEYEGVPVTEIADFAGCNLESVVKISIGKNVETIGTWAFENNQSLKEFYVDPENENFCCVDGVLFTKDMKELLFYPSANETEYCVPNGVEKIRTKAFYKCDKLTSLTLPDTITEIEEKAFFKCSSLEEFVIPNGVTTIGKDAFGYCSSLTEITVPSTVASIGDYAFFNCTQLLTVNMQLKQEDITLGTNWQPTNNGLAINELTINWE